MSTTEQAISKQVEEPQTGVVASLLVEFDVPASMRDGVVLRADVYQPAGEGGRGRRW